MAGWLQRLFDHVALGDHAYRFLFDAGPADEVVSLDCETTGLDTRHDEILAIAAIRVAGNRILTSERFEAIIRPDVMPTAESIRVHRLRARDVAEGLPVHRVLPDLLRFIGGRPLLGYYIDFDVRMLNRHILPLIQIRLPNPLIEVSALYYERKYGDAPPGTAIDLRFAAMMEDLGIAPLEQHIAVNDAVMAAEAYLQLRDLQRRAVRVRRRRGVSLVAPTGG